MPPSKDNNVLHATMLDWRGGKLVFKMSKGVNPGSLKSIRLIGGGPA